MDEAVAYREMIEHASDSIRARVEEVPADKLHQRPGPGLNPVGWNYWHALRVWDLDLNWYIKGQSPQQDAWYRGDFSARSGYDPTGKGLRGTGIGLDTRTRTSTSLQSSRPACSSTISACY